MTSLIQTTFFLTAMTTVTSGSTVEFLADQTSGGLRLRCSLEEGPDDVTTDQPDIAFVNSILISRAGGSSLVASITPYFDPRAFGEQGEKPEVTGSLSEEKGFIEVTWPPSDSVRSGGYDCDVTGIAGNGVSYTLTKTVAVRSEEEEETQGQMMKYILEMQSTLDEVKNTTDKHSSLIDDLRDMTAHDSASVDDLKQTVQTYVAIIDKLDNITEIDAASTSDLQGTSANATVSAGDSLVDLQLATQQLQLELDQLNARLNTKVFFTAGLETDQKLKTNGVVVFDKVITQVIQTPPADGATTVATKASASLGYNPRTGHFVCPLAGHYQFHVTVVDKVVNVSLQVNGVGVMSLVAWHQLVYLTGSNSAIVRLARGDKVTVVADYKTLLVGNMFPMTTFSGRLLDP